MISYTALLYSVENDLSFAVCLLSYSLVGLSKGEPDNVRLKGEVADLKLACSSSERRTRLLQDELEQARMMAQELERVQEHSVELEKEVSEARGLLNDKDRSISEQILVSSEKL